MTKDLSASASENPVTEPNSLQHAPTLKDAYYTWMELSHPKAPGLRNKDRKANELKNYERALRCYAAGINDGNDDLSAVTQERLVVSNFVLGCIVEEGAARLNARKARSVRRKGLVVEADDERPKPWLIASYAARVRLHCYATALCV